MPFNANVTRTIDWFIPTELLQNREMRTRARMFLFSHMFGPILGNSIPAFLLWVDPASWRSLVVLAGSVTGFWVFPFFLKFTGEYELLSYLSIQNLLFAILWGCYFHGGLSSPFLPWLVTVPLLAFFYLSASVTSCFMIMLQITVSVTTFIYLIVSKSHFPSAASLERLQSIGLISIICAAIYVSMMALYYAGILRSQSEFEKEVQKHLETSDQLRKAVSQAERASAAKADFLAKTSHELRTPLNAVIGYSEMLLEDSDPASDPQEVEDLNKIHSAGRHLLCLVNAILDLSKIEAGKMQVFPETVETRVLLQGVADRWSSDPRMKGRAIRVIVEDSAGAAEVDPAKLEQVLDALIDNAVRYAPNSDVEIAAHGSLSQGDCDAVEVSVSDKGPGIAPQLLPTLFETFSDVEDAGASKYGGPGLGLPLANRLCGVMGAQLSVRATSKAGTTMVIAIPSAKVDASPIQPQLSDLAEAA